MTNKILGGDSGNLVVVACAGAFGVFATVFCVSWSLMQRGPEAAEAPAVGANATQQVEASPRTVSPMKGSVSSIRIRASGTLGGGEPLILVDDVQISPGSDAVLDEFEPADIERIDVIKGPVAVKLYGENAADGAIKIKLKASARRQGDARGS